MLRLAIFKAIRPALLEVIQGSLTRAIIGKTHTEDSARQNPEFQARFLLHQGFKDYRSQSIVAHEIVSVGDSVCFPTA